MKLGGREVIESALAAVGEILALRGSSCSIVILGGAALNLHGVVDRPTIDVDVLAREQEGILIPPDPLPDALRSAIAAIARDRGFLEHWMNTAVAGHELYASADQTGPENVHVRDLLALRPTAVELDDAAEWVRRQDPSPGFHEILAKVVSYVDGALR